MAKTQVPSSEREATISDVASPGTVHALALTEKRLGGRPRHGINVHFEFHTKKNISCKYCDKFSRRNTRGLPDRFDHLATCTGFIIQHPEQHAAIVAESSKRNTAVDLEAVIDVQPANDEEVAVKGRKPHASRVHFLENLPEEGKKRGTATCKHCKFLVRNSIPENFLRHLQQCVGCPPSVRLEMAIVQRKSNEAAEMRASRRASQDISGAVATPVSAHKRQKLDSGASSSHCDGLPSWRASQLDGLLLQWLLSSDVAFSSVRDPAFMALASALLPAWRPPGPKALRDTLLPTAYQALQATHKTFLQGQPNSTVSIDRWSPDQLAVVVRRNDGHTALLDLANDAAVAAACQTFCDSVGKQILRLGTADVAAVVCADAEVWQTMRTSLSQDAGLRHIIPMRDSLDAYSLALQAFISHPHAAYVIGRAQHISTFFLQRHAAATAIAAAQSTTNTTTAIAAATSSSYATVLHCLRSIVANRPALEMVVDLPQAQAAIEESVAAVIRDSAFWKEAEALDTFLRPASAVLDAVKGGSVPLADCFYHWLVLARSFVVNSSKLPSDYVASCHREFSARWGNTDTDIARLALFLNPKFRSLAGQFHFKDTVVAALQLLQNCGLPQAACGEVRAELMAYKAGLRGYAVTGDYPDDVITWWRCQDLPHNHPLVLLIVRLYTLRPHAAYPASLFGAAGSSDKSSRRADSLEVAKQQAAIRMSCEDVGAGAERRKQELEAACQGTSAEQLAEDLAVEGVVMPSAKTLVKDFAEMWLRYIASEVVPCGTAAREQLLSGDFDLRHEALDPDYQPTPTPPLASLAQLAVEGAGLDLQFDIQDLVKDL